jgi:acyl-CoA reductase-like NAD-dependent aldehyde dehydrogenase
MVIGEKPGEERFSGEKHSPVMALWRYKTIDEAIELIATLHKYAGLKGREAGARRVFEVRAVWTVVKQER